MTISTSSTDSATALTVLATVSELLAVPVADLRAQPVLAAYDWDSFTSLDALAQLESKLGIDFDLRAFNAARTVSDLIVLAEQA